MTIITLNDNTVRVGGWVNPTEDSKSNLGKSDPSFGLTEQLVLRKHCEKRLDMQQCFGASPSQQRQVEGSVDVGVLHKPTKG